MAKVIIQKLSEAEIKERNIKKWPIWKKGVSRFEHVYDGDEECLFLEGEVIIETKEGNYSIVPGDFVIFEDGLECVWDIQKPVKKHYNFPS
ncbi:MAG: cupin domain-containing protein [Bacteroidota bacterium]|nr:cupin domain-containing protein [Bacteroidota bacterium]